MKFTYTQKKWAMTGVLLAVLGFNVSMNKHTDGIASADFASESGDLVESKIATADGVLNVKYIKSGENEVMAVIPKVTEGKTCDVCGTTYTLDASLEKNKSNIDELNVQLLKQIAKGKPLQAPRETAVEPASLQENKPSLEEKTAKSLARIKQICADTTPYSDCISDEMGRFFQKNSKSMIPQGVVINFLASEYIIPLDKEIDLAAKDTYEQVRQGLNPAYGQQVVSTKRKQLIISLGTLLAKIPSKDEAIRSSMIKLAGSLVTSEKEKSLTSSDSIANNWRSQMIADLGTSIQATVHTSYQESAQIESNQWADSYSKLLLDTMMNIDNNYNQGQTFGQVQPAPTGTVSQGTATGVRGSGTRDGIQVTPGGTTALPAPSSIKSSGAPGPIAAPVQGVPNVGMTGYQLQTQSAQDALAPRVQLAPRGY